MTDPVDIQEQYKIATVMSISNILGDRQCPAGYLYMLNPEDIHVVVDPRMKWKWTEPRSYPNQLTFTRVFSTRFFLRTVSRMFLGVGAGIVA